MQLDVTPIRKTKPAFKPLDININTLKQTVTASPKDATPSTPDFSKSPITPRTPYTPKFDLENVDPFSPITSSNLSTEPRKQSNIRKPQKRIRSPILNSEPSPGMLHFVLYKKDST